MVKQRSVMMRRYRALKQGWMVAALVHATGCGSNDISAGEEGDTINLANCYGVECGLSTQSVQGQDAGTVACSMGTTELVGEPFEPHGKSLNPRQMRAAPDGTLWMLAETSPNGFYEFFEPVLLRYSAEGELLDISEPLQSGADHTHMESRLGVDADGNALVAIYSVYAETADADLVERLNLYTVGSDMTFVSPPVSFRGISTAYPSPSPSGGVLLAGNALDNARHGVITHLVDGEPEWIQAKLKTGGQAVSGVSDLVVDEEGISAVLSQREARSETGGTHYSFGVALVAPDGRPLRDLIMPTLYDSGYFASLAALESDFVVSGMLGRGTLLVRRLSRSGELGWGFTLPASWPNVVVDSTTGRTFVDGLSGIAVVEADGEECRILPVDLSPEGPQRNDQGVMVVREPYIYSGTSQGVTRYTLPTPVNQ